MSSDSSASFPTTVWTVVRAAQDPHSPEALAAMNRCLAGYWKPVFCYLRARSYPVHAAEDLTQAFFLRFFERNWIRPADPGRGRFRCYLLAILKRFLSDQGPDRAPRQKTFEDQLVCVSSLMGDQERAFEPPIHVAPDDVFMKHWAQAVIANVRRGVESWCQERGRPDWYQIFCATHFPSPDGPRATQQTLAERFHVSRDQVRYALEEVNRQFVSFLQRELSEQVDSDDELEEEVRDLERLLGQ